MSKKYYIWKDRNCNGVNPEWIELSGSKFYQFIKSPENKTRRFEVLDNRVCDDADILAFEVTEERYREFSKVHRHERYLDDCSQGYFCVSMQDSISEDEDLTLEEVIADENVDVEETVIDIVTSKQVKEIVNMLSGQAKFIAELLLLSYETGKSEREICREFSIPQTSFRNYKKRIFKIIEKKLAQNE